MTTTLPILSDILEDVVSKISVITEAEYEPFKTEFEFGPLSEVSKSIYSYDPSTVVIWLVEKGEDRKRSDIYGNGSCDIVIGLQTDSNWTMAERMNTNYKPKLLPVYELLIKELRSNRGLNNSYKIDHKKYNLYYWGGGNVNGTNAPNLWEKMIDAVLIEGANISIKNKC
jgi:hypothetical protein